MKLSRIRSIVFSTFSILGTLAGTLVASLVLQSLFLNPSYSETSIEARKEIEDCARDAGKFLSRMEFHAALSGKAYVEALQELPVGTRKAVEERCQGDADKSLIHRALCYRNTLKSVGGNARAIDRMSASIDELTRWSAIASACDRTLGNETCHGLRQWRSTDFVPAHSDEVKYAPKSSVF